MNSCNKSVPQTDLWPGTCRYLTQAAVDAQKRGDSNAAITLETDVIETYVAQHLHELACFSVNPGFFTFF